MSLKDIRRKLLPATGSGQAFYRAPVLTREDVEDLDQAIIRLDRADRVEKELRTLIRLHLEELRLSGVPLGNWGEHLKREL